MRSRSTFALALTTSLACTGCGDDPDPAAAQPFTVRGELAYAAGGPQLPGALAMVERGALDGRVLIADVRGLFVVDFRAGAVVEDAG
jgi:hypothetical protein